MSDARPRAAAARAATIALLISGIALAIGFDLEMSLPMRVSIVLLFALTAWALVFLKITECSFLPRLFIVLFTMPFAVTVVYLFLPNVVWWPGRVPIDPVEEIRFMTHVSGLGLIGLLGLLGGLCIVRWRSSGPRAASACQALPKGVASAPCEPHRCAVDRRPMPTLPLWAFTSLLVASLFFSWLNLPKGTFFTVYRGGQEHQSIAAQVQFDAVWLISYLIIVLLYLDARREMVWMRRGASKHAAVLGATTLIILAQVITGERESFGLIVALVAIYLSEPYSGCLRDPTRAARMFWARFPRACLVLVGIAGLYLVLGHARVNAPPRLPSEEGDSIEALIQAGARMVYAKTSPWRRMWFANTWTSVLLTNLALAKEADDPGRRLLLGRTYWDYVLSLPPGMLARAVGYTRPIDSDRGPEKWYVGQSDGGMHPVCIPYRNFGATGTVAILCLFGLVIGYADLASRSRNIVSLMVYGTVITCSFVWFWYSEMGLIRGAMIATGLVVVYRWLAVVHPLWSSASVALDPQERSNGLPERSLSH